MNSFKISFINGVLWSFLERISGLIITFIVTIILSRILGPNEYGLIGILSIFTVLGTVFIDSGFGHALVQKKIITDEDYSTIFYLNILIGIIIYGVLFFVSPYIALFYGEPSLISIARIIFLLIPINSLGIVQNSIFLRAMEFKQLSIVSIISSIVSGIIGISLAMLNHGVWAIVFQTLSYNITKVIMLWLLSNWNPSAIFSIETIKELWGYSVNLLGVHTLAAIFQNIYTALIGKFFLISDVGYYNQALKLETIPSGTINSVIQQVTFPILSRIQNDDEALRSAYKRIIKLTMYLNFPLMLGVIIPAENIISIILSNKWIPGTRYFQLLCIASSLYPLHMVNVIILKAKGLGKIYFNLELFKRILMVIFILITIKISITWLLIGAIISTILSVFANMYYCGKAINYSINKQVRDMVPILLCTSLMILVIYLITLFNLNKYIELLIQTISGISIYWLLSYVFKLDAYLEIIQIFNNFIKKRR